MEISDLKFAFASTLNDIIVGSQELRKPQLVRVLDIRNQQGAGTVLLCRVDGDAQIDICSPQPDRASIHQPIAIIELRKLIKRAKQGPGDQMRVRSLAAVVFLEMFV